ncbi:MAG: AfsR/SARP family transcriptional regulator [Actinoplanes sp.]
MSARYGDRVRVAFGVLGPVTAWNAATGEPIALRGPRHRAVLARLIVARGRTVPVGHLVDDLWVAPPPGAVSALRTFVAALRRAVEPDRPPRSPATLLVTAGPGYALRAAPGTVDAWRFEQAVTEAAARPPLAAASALTAALAEWRGPAYADFPEAPWTVADRARLTELRLHAVEQQAEARLAAGRPAEAVPDLDAHVTEHPWREDGWRLLALSLYRSGRQADALTVLRRARTLLTEQLGLDPGPALRSLESDIRHQSGTLSPAGAAGRVWAEATADYDRIVASGARARLDSTVGMLRDLAVTGGGGLEAARRHRPAAIAAAEELGDPVLAARVIGAYDVPAIWTRSDDPEQAAAVVAAAERALARLPAAGFEAARARLLATVAVETRGVVSERASAAAREAERIARGLDDPALLAFALNGVFMQSFGRTGLAPVRDRIGAELIDLAGRHGLVTAEVLGRLIRIQSRAALADLAGADEHAAAADRLATRHELPLVAVFTEGYRALRLAAGPAPATEVAAAYQTVAARLSVAGMPGLERGLLPLALLAVRLRDGRPDEDPAADFGPYEPWVRPLLLAGAGRRDEAAAALRAAPEPSPDLLTEAMWWLMSRAARALGDEDKLRQARQALEPAAGELAGAASGLITFGPIATELSAP